ncbi:phage minor head protein [Pseudoalteromonas denitrificans]|nr:phage minor head protein [Pseudoalteromonas denitrificans]
MKALMLARKNNIQVIYQNNKNTARAAGRWQQQERLKQRRPYLMYLTAGDLRVRPEHGAWHKIVLHIDHEFWFSHYPPNGWGCRCRVVSLNSRDIKRLNLKVTDQDKLIDVVTVDEKTGGLAGIDLGWDYNPGKAWLGSDIVLGKSLVEMPANIRDIAIPEFNKAVLKSKPHYINAVNEIAAKVALDKFKDDQKVFTLGYIASEEITKLLNKAKPILNSLITISSAEIASLLKSGVRLEVLTLLMTTLHDANLYKYRNGMLEITDTDIKVKISEPFNIVLISNTR